MNNKKYYYLKLKDNFYDRPEIKAIEGIPNGYEYICIMQKMYLRSLGREGRLMLTDTIPYETSTLASVLNHRIEVIKAAIDIFQTFGLLEILDDKTIYMSEIQNFIGESSTEADRIRMFRKKIDDNKKALLALNSQESQIPYKCTPELEKELDIDLEKEKDKHKEGGLPLQVKIKNVKNAKTEYFLDLLPSDSAQDFINAWLEWVDYRKEIKKKIVVSTAKKQISFLSRQKEPIACINQSIEKGWEGLFEINTGLIKKIKNYEFQKGDGDGFKVIQ